MTLKKFVELIEDDDIYLDFSEVSSKNKLSNRPDLCAFLILDKLIPRDCDIISAAEHDEFYISVDVEELIKVIDEETVADLRMCGVIYSEESLMMFA